MGFSAHVWLRELDREREKTLSFTLNTIGLQNNVVLADGLNEALFINNEVF